MNVPYVPRSSADRMTTSGPIFRSFGQKPQGLINQEEWLAGPPQKGANSKVAKSPLGPAGLGRQICGVKNNLPQSSAAKILPGPAGPGWQMCDGGKNLPQLQHC